MGGNMPAPPFRLTYGNTSQLPPFGLCRRLLAFFRHLAQTLLGVRQPADVEFVQSDVKSSFRGSEAYSSENYLRNHSTIMCGIALYNNAGAA